MNYFTVNLPIFELDDNEKIKIPDFVKNIWFDVGTSFNSPNSIYFLKRNPKGFVICFEPDPRMYFGVYARHYVSENVWLVDNNHPTAKIERDKRTRNGLHSSFCENTEEFVKENDVLTRYIIVPTAISNSEGHKLLYLDKHHGSSSFSGKSVSPTGKSHYVPTFPLSKFIKMILDRFEHIDHLKIDAEGHDINVLESGDITKFVVITMEMRDDKYLESRGFRFIKAQNGGHSYVNKKYEHLLSGIDYHIRG